MNTRIFRWAFSLTGLLAAAVLVPASLTQAQEANGPVGKGRTTDERVTTESPRPLSATGEANRIEAQQDPRINPPAGGRDVAMLVEHAVGMAIEGSSLLAIVESNPKSSNEPDAVHRLRDKARKLMSESQSLLNQAANDGKGLAANPAVGRFHASANLYITTLAAIETTNPEERAQVVLINQAVKDVLDADHIRQMAPMVSGSAPLEQLRNHAALMKTQGNELIRSMMGSDKIDSAPKSVNVTTLATRGRQLLEAADEMGRSPGSPSAGANNPGRFQNNRPAIIGGTFSNGDPRVGTYQNAGHAPGSTLPPAQSEPSPVPNNSNQTTGSTGGLNPR